MKKVILCIAVLACSTMTMSAQNNNFKLKGEMKNLGDSLIVLSKDSRDTVLVKNDKFSFSKNITEPTTIQAVTPGTFHGQERKFFTLIAVPNESAELKGDITTRYDITGSKYYKEYHEVDMMLENSQKEMAEYGNSIEKRLANGEDREVLTKEYQEKFPIMQQKIKKTMFDFIKAHPNYESNIAILYELESYDELKEAVGYMSDNVKNGRMKATCDKIVNNAKKKEEAEAAAAKKQAAGADAADFTLNDINGKPFTLSSLRGKYVLLDFWGSWCGWCIKGMPQMKEYYAKYKGKFEIVGVDCNDTQEKWKAAVEKHQLPWIHVYNVRNEKDVCSSYSIQGFPTKILIGPDGKIVKTVVGEDPAFYTFLDETFGK